MGFDLEAFLGRSAGLRGWKRHLPSAVVCELGGEPGLVPLTGALYRELAARLGDEAARLDAAQKYRTWPSPGMQEGVRRWAAEASRGTMLAHVSTGEFGDTSYEHVTVWDDGAVALTGGASRRCSAISASGGWTSAAGPSTWRSIAARTPRRSGPPPRWTGRGRGDSRNGRWR